MPNYGMKGGDANRQVPKGTKQGHAAHTAKTPYGMGDYYGSGIRNKIGSIRDSSVMNPIPKGKLGNPPKSLA